MTDRAHDLVAALRFHKHPLTRQAATRISQLEEALRAAESFIDGWKFERIDEDCEVEAQDALVVIRAALAGPSERQKLANLRHAVDRICLGCGAEVEPDTKCECGEHNPPASRAS